MSRSLFVSRIPFVHGFKPTVPFEFVTELGEVARVSCPLHFLLLQCCRELLITLRVVSGVVLGLSIIILSVAGKIFLHSCHLLLNSHHLL